MQYKEFEKLVWEALEDLPDFFKKKIKNVAVVIEDDLSPQLKRSLGRPRGQLVLGLYQGVPLLNRSSFQGVMMPDKITIFKRNIEQVARTDEEIKQTVRHTVQHEIAHHFGITDEELRKMGVY